VTTITDFDAFLDNVDNYHEDVVALNRAVNDVTDEGLYKCEIGNRPNTWIVSAPHIEESLFLASPQAKAAFLQAIPDRFVRDDEMDVETWHQMRRALERDNS